MLESKIIWLLLSFSKDSSFTSRKPVGFFYKYTVIAEEKMIEDVVARAKYLQDKYNTESSSLRPEILKFHHNLIEGLITFVNLAKEKGIVGVNFKDIKDLGEGVKEFCFQIDEDNLALVMRNEVYPIDFKNEYLGNNAYIYYDGDSSFTPAIEISIYKDSNDIKFYSISWFASDKKKTITGDIKLDETAGINTAEKIVRFFYNRSRCWKNKPTREDFSSHMSKKGKTGFLD